MVNGPTFNAPNAKAFHKSLKLLAPTTDRIPEVKKGVSAVMRTVEKTLEVFGGQSALAKALGGEPPNERLSGRNELLPKLSPTKRLHVSGGVPVLLQL